MPDAIARALAELEKRLSALDPAVRKEMLSEAAHHLEDLRAAHDGDAEAAVAEFGDMGKLGAALTRACGARRGRVLGWLTFAGATLPAVGMTVHAYGLPWEFSWFVVPLAIAFAIQALRTPRFAWRSIAVGAVAGGAAVLVFLAAATIDVGERDGHFIQFAPTAEGVVKEGRQRLAQLDRWQPGFETMRRAGRGDTAAIEELSTPAGYVVLDMPPFWNVYTHTAQPLPTTVTTDLNEAKIRWRSAPAVMGMLVNQRGRLEEVSEAIAANPTVRSRFLPQLKGYAPSALGTVGIVFSIGALTHLLMLVLRFVGHAAIKRVRPRIAG